MIPARLARLAALQRPDGAFGSVMTTRAGPADDANGFTTACVLRALRGIDAPALQPLRQRALDFLATCESPSPPGTYAFWPPSSRPAWAARVPPDADDTALVLVELLRHGRIAREAALRALCTAMLPCRVRPGECDAMPTWIVAGCFGTWIAPWARERRRPVVDACVNANVAALIAFIAATQIPGYAEACEAIARALEWAGRDRARIASLTPFYPSVASLSEALGHAVECGAAALAPAARRARDLAREAHDEDAGCCAGAYGDVVWRCPALDEARAIAGPRAA